jgi:ABC-type branched-subunit amino acid transport system ATPase component
VLVIEEPFAGLSSAQAEGLTKLMRGHEIGKDVTWVAVTHVRNHWESSKTTAKR